MVKRFFLFLVCAILLLNLTDIAEPAQSTFVSDEQLNNWMAYYYLSPEPDKIYQAMKYFCRSKLYNNQLILPFMSFCVAVLKDKDTLLEKIYIEINQDSTTREKTFFLDVLWLINNKESSKLIEKARVDWTDKRVQNKIKQQDKSQPYDVLTIPIVSAKVLDMLWFAFSATGNEEPIKRIISVLPWAKEKKGSQMLLGAVAKWSLESNARQHERVLIICEKELKEQQGLTKGLLEEIIKKANQ